MVDIVLSPEVDEFVEALPQPERGLTRGRLRRYGDPERLVRETRPLLGSAQWRVATVGPFKVTLRLLTEEEARACHAVHPALQVATIDRIDDLRADGERQIEEAEAADDEDVGDATG